MIKFFKPKTSKKNHTRIITFGYYDRSVYMESVNELLKEGAILSSTNMKNQGYNTWYEAIMIIKETNNDPSID